MKQHTFKFKVGDRVRVLDGANIPTYTGGWFPEDMKKLIGNVYTITNLRTDFNYPAYMIKDISFFILDERGLELAESTTTENKTNNSKYFKNWITKMNKKFWDNPNYHFCYDSNQKTVLVANLKTGKQGIAKCHPSDEFDRSTGIAIAYARCCGKPVPPTDFEPMKKEKKEKCVVVPVRLMNKILEAYDECDHCPCSGLCDNLYNGFGYHLSCDKVRTAYINKFETIEK